MSRRQLTMRLTQYPAICLTAALLFTSGCKKQENAFVPPPPAKVEVAQPVIRSISEQIEFTGTTRALAKVDLRAKVSGTLMEIKFEDGAYVEKDDLLFVIEQDPFLRELESRQADLSKAKANLALKVLTVERTEKLQRENATTQQALDIARAEKSTADAEVASAEAAVKIAELNLSYTEIKAPISGQIGRHLVDIGNLIQTGTTPLATIESIDPIHAYFYISETDVLRFMNMIREKQLPNPHEQHPEIKMGLLTDLDFPYTGKLDFRELGVDPTTGTILRRAVFENKDRNLIPGLFVRLQAELGSPKERVMVQDRAIGSEQRGNYLLIVDEKNVVQHRPVKLGMAVGDLRVIEDGLKAGEWVVVNGLQKARPGSVVDPQKPGDAAKPAARADGKAATAAAPAAEAKPADTAEKSAPSASGAAVPENK